MRDDPCNITRWKRERGRSNRGNVWDKIVTDWAGKEDWMRERKVKSALIDKSKFVTFAHDRVKMSTVHRKERGEGRGKKVNGKRLGDLGSADTTIHTRAEGPTVQPCGVSEVASKWVNGQYSLGQKYRGRISLIQKTLYSWWERNNANSISKTDDYVKHIFREHTQEADHWAIVGAERQRIVVIDRKGNAETWKAVKGFWDGSCKENGKSGDQRSSQRKLGHHPQKLRFL